MNTKRLTVVIVVFLTILFTNFRTAAACTPTEPDWWFSEKFEVEIDHNIHPVGLNIRTDVVSTRGGERARIHIGNNTGTRIYLVSNSLLPDVTIEQPASGLPPGYTAFELLRGGQYFFCGMDDLQNLIPGFTDQNMEAPDRPHDVKVPASQNGELYILFEEELFTFPVTLHYSLNPEYDPQNGKGGCGNIIFLVPLLLISEHPYVCLIPLLFPIGIGLFWLSKPRNKTISQ